MRAAGISRRLFLFLDSRMMTTTRMHADEISVDNVQASLVIGVRFPQHSGLP
jgi:hypothetical protein